MTKSIKLNLEQMEKAGVGFGHKVSKLHPKMKPYIAGVKNSINIFDLQKIAEEFEKALAFISKTASEGKTIVLVGTKIQLRNIVKVVAEECGIPYVTERWLGGTFTNFETIQKRVSYFKDLEKKKQTGELSKYTKKERLDFDREIEALKVKFDGIRDMQKLPDVVVIFGLDKDLTCALEAKRKGIKIVAVVDTNVNPDIADYMIPANDDTISSVQYVLDNVRDAIISSRQIKK